ncbi:MAG: hypothetical protein ACRC50_10240, partial [Gaiella sp.]
EIDEEEVGHAFVWSDGVLTDLGLLPGATHSGAASMSGNGQIVGSSYVPGATPGYGVWHAVSWTLTRG